MNVITFRLHHISKADSNISLMFKEIVLSLIVASALGIEVYSCAEQGSYSLTFTYIDGTPDTTTRASLCHDH